MKTISLNGVELDLHSGPIGVSISGGADSALLAYILMQNVTDQIHFFTIASKEKNFKSVEHTGLILNKLVQITGNFNVQHHIKYVETQTRNNLLAFLKSVQSNIKVMYTATTSFPDDNIMHSFNSSLPNDIKLRRGATVNKKLYSDDRFFYSPFYNIDKKKISEIYDTLNIREDIFPLTRSCESTIIIDKHCGNCWWCEERKWAFNEL